MKQFLISIAIVFVVLNINAQNNQSIKEKEKRIAPNGVFSTESKTANTARSPRPIRSKETLQKLISPNGVFATGQSGNAKATPVGTKQNIQLPSSISSATAAAQRTQAEAKNDVSAQPDPLRFIKSQDEKPATPASKTITPAKPPQVLKKKD